MKKVVALIISVLIALSGIFFVFAENGSFEEKTLFHIASEQVSHNEHLAFEGKFFSAGVTAELIGVVFLSTAVKEGHDQAFVNAVMALEK